MSNSGKIALRSPVQSPEESPTLDKEGSRFRYKYLSSLPSPKRVDVTDIDTEKARFKADFSQRTVSLPDETTPSSPYIKNSTYDCPNSSPLSASHKGVPVVPRLLVSRQLATLQPSSPQSVRRLASSSESRRISRSSISADTVTKALQIEHTPHLRRVSLSDAAGPGGDEELAGRVCVPPLEDARPARATRGNFDLRTENRSLSPIKDRQPSTSGVRFGKDAQLDDQDSENLSSVDGLHKHNSFTGRSRHTSPRSGDSRSLSPIKRDGSKADKKAAARERALSRLDKLPANANGSTLVPLTRPSTSAAAPLWKPVSDCKDNDRRSPAISQQEVVDSDMTASGISDSGRETADVLTDASRNLASDCNPDLLKHFENLEEEVKRLKQIEKEHVQKINALQECSKRSKKDHDEEVECMRAKLKSMAATLRESISRCDEEAARDRETVDELFKQLAAAKKAIANLKEEVSRMTEENQGLKANESVLLEKINALQDEAKARSQGMSGAQAEDTSDTCKKVRLAKDQMAKMIARHEKEIASWSTQCQELKNGNEERNKEIKNLQAQNRTLQTQAAELQLQIANRDAPNDRLDQAVQTEIKPSRFKAGWHPWIWLLTLSLWSANKPTERREEAAQTDLSIDSRIKRLTKDAATITQMEVTTYASDYERWWKDAITRGEDESKLLKVKGAKAPMTIAQLLSLISQIYAEKLLQDELDDREGVPRMTLAEFLHLHFIQQTETLRDANAAFVTTVANLVSCVKNISPSTSYDWGPKLDFDAVTAIKPLKSDSIIARRIVLFCRFLGLSVLNQEPIQLDALSMYLVGLNRLKKGVLPLLPTSGEKIVVTMTEYLQTLDWIFARLRLVVKETIKVDIITLNQGEDNIDLEYGLEYALQHWESCSFKFDTRLESVFASGEDKFDYRMFHELMNRIRTDENENHSHNLRLRMYKDMCIYPRVDSTVFVQVLKRYSVLTVKLGPLIQQKLEISRSNLFDSLDPLFLTANHTIKSKLAELDDVGVGKGIEKKWTICQVLMHRRWQDLLREREEPELAWIFYTTVTRHFSEASRQYKKR